MLRDENLNLESLVHGTGHRTAQRLSDGRKMGDERHGNKLIDSEKKKKETTERQEENMMKQIRSFSRFIILDSRLYRSRTLNAIGVAPGADCFT